MIAVRGAGSAIWAEFVRLIAGLDGNVVIPRDADMPTTCERYLFCAGFMAGQRVQEVDGPRLAETFAANCVDVARQCDRIIERNNRARICIIGSESGFSGSFDFAYAAAKAGIHLYVETKRLRTPDQQLVAVAPGIIADAGMTTRRTDTEDLARRAADHPKGRWLTSREVARLAHFLLYDDRGYVSGVVIRMNGGVHACR